jgi:hypothetical protein
MGSGSLGGGSRRCCARGMISFLAAIAVAITITGGMTAGTRAEGTAAVAAPQLNLRSEPSTAAPVVALMVEGETVSLLAGPTTDGWYQVQYGDVAGWVYGSFLVIDDAPGWGAELEPSSPLGAPTADPTSDGSSATTLTVVIDPATVTAPVALTSAIVPPTSDPEPTPATQTQSDETPLAPQPTATLEVTPEPAWAAEQRAKDSSNHKKGKDRDKPPPEAPAPTATPTPAATEEASATPTVTATPSSTSEPEHWVDVNRSNQLVTLYEGDKPIAAFPASLGFDSSDSGYYATAIGTYYIYNMYAGLNWTDWGQAWIRDWIGFDPERQNGFHSYSMDASGTVLPDGDGPTGGCVALAPAAADQLFAFVTVGTRVVVHR